MTGNLSHQIEHHIFPDLPSNRYAEIAPRVRAVFDKFDLDYNSRPLVQQVGSAWHKVVRLSLPNGWLAETNRRNLVPQLRRLIARPAALPGLPPVSTGMPAACGSLVVARRQAFEGGYGGRWVAEASRPAGCLLRWLRKDEVLSRNHRRNWWQEIFRKCRRIQAVVATPGGSDCLGQ